MIKNCKYPPDSKIVLYGAGRWGRICYKWICRKQYGEIVGWVDNAWSSLKDMDFSIMPVDTLLRIKYDYVLIAIKEKLLQEEVIQNLMSWGIPRSKILSFDMVE